MFKRFWSRPRAERAALLRALVLLPATRLFLRIVGYRRTAASLDRLAHASPAAQAGSLTPQTLSELVDLAARRTPVTTATCLPRSLVLRHLLQRNGHPAVVRFGVRLGEGQIIGHAWVELGGRVIGDAADVAQVYAPFDGIAPNMTGNP